MAVAHEVAEGLGVKKAEKKEELKTVEIKPTDNKKLWIKIPSVEAKVYSSNKLEFFPIKLRLEELKRIKPKLIKADIVSRQTEEAGEVEIKEEINPINRIVRLIILEMSEFDISFKAILQKIVKHYLDQLQVTGKELSRLVKLHEQTILNDILPQLQEKLQEQTRIKFRVLDEVHAGAPQAKRAMHRRN